MAFKDLLAIVLSAEQESVLAAAEALAARWKAHVAALHLVELPQPVATPYGADMWGEIMPEARQQAAADREKISARLKSFDPPAELRWAEAYPALLEDAVAYSALHADLTIVESASAGPGRLALEAALFNSGRPLLVTPPQWRGDALGRRILVAWSATRECARAVADAAPFLEAAESVRIVTVDAKPASGSSSPPGVDIAAHLARRGTDVDLRHVDGLGREAEDALLDEARAIDADLIVMGGYGHSRLRQFVFGGVTRALTQMTPVPLFMAH
ncbi:MAG: universal stress protein [Hyphomonadaceae bacterium]